MEKTLFRTLASIFVFKNIWSNENNSFSNFRNNERLVKKKKDKRYLIYFSVKKNRYKVQEFQNLDKCLYTFALWIFLLKFTKFILSYDKWNGLYSWFEIVCILWFRWNFYQICFWKWSRMNCKLIYNYLQKFQQKKCLLTCHSKIKLFLLDF